jgi:hypothetical protein
LGKGQIIVVIVLLAIGVGSYYLSNQEDTTVTEGKECSEE